MVQTDIVSEPQGILLPTGGVTRDTPSLPSRTGRFRIEHFAMLMYRYPKAFGVITGGMPDAAGRTEADAYMEFLRQRYPDVAARVVVVNGEGDFTIDDMIFAIQRLREERGCIPYRLACVTRPGHYQRVKPVLQLLGCDPYNEPSGESYTIVAVLIDTLLGKVSQKDPEWRKPLGRLLRKNVEYRARKKRVRT